MMSLRRVYSLILLVSLLMMALFTNSCTPNRYHSIRQEIEAGNYQGALYQVRATHPRDAQHNLLLAEAAYHVGDFDLFIESLSRALRQDDDVRDDVLYLLRLADVELTEKAFVQFLAEQFNAAHQTIDVVLYVRYLYDWVKTPGDRGLSTPEIIEYAGEALVKDDMIAEASIKFSHLDKETLEELNARERLTYVYFELERWDRANKLAREIMSQQDSKEGRTLFSEQLAMHNQRLDSVLTMFIPVIRERQLIERPLLDTHMGNSFYRRSEWDNVRYRYEQVLQTDPGNRAEFLTLLGESWFLQGSYSQAKDAFEEALELDPDNIDILKYLGLAKLQLGQVEEARSMFARAREVKGLKFIRLTTEPEQDETEGLLEKNPILNEKSDASMNSGEQQ